MKNLILSLDQLFDVKFDILEISEMNKAFVIIPQQSGPGQPVQLMMSLYNAFGKSDTITIAQDKIVFQTDPKDEILKSYEQNTSRILQPKAGLITENTVPKL